MIHVTEMLKCQEKKEVTFDFQAKKTGFTILVSWYFSQQGINGYRGCVVQTARYKYKAFLRNR